MQKSFQAWLRPGFGEFRLEYNADRLEALATERASEWDRIGKAHFLTLDEQREAVGFGPAPKAGIFAKRGSNEQCQERLELCQRKGNEKTAR